MSDTKNFYWDGFAKLLAKIYAEQEISHVMGEDIAQSALGSEYLCAVSIAAMDVTVFSMPIATVEGEDWQAPVRAMCESHGLRFLGASLAPELAECVVVTLGCGLSCKPGIEALWRELDADLERSRLSATSD